MLLSNTDFIDACRRLREQGRAVVFTNGCFDILHAGHVAYLEAAAALGDHLVVAINSDRSISALKGPSRPIVPEEDRAAVIALRPASPGWSGFVIVPKFWRLPLAIDAAMPRAFRA